MVMSKHLHLISVGAIFVLLLLVIPSGRAVAQTYGWRDTNCAWPGNPVGPFPSAISDYNTCVATYYTYAGSDLFQFDGEYNGPSKYVNLHDKRRQYDNLFVTSFMPDEYVD
jgi:hypothetical protein